MRVGPSFGHSFKSMHCSTFIQTPPLIIKKHSNRYTNPLSPYPSYTNSTICLAKPQPDQKNIPKSTVNQKTAPLQQIRHDAINIAKFLQSFNRNRSNEEEEISLNSEKFQSQSKQVARSAFGTTVAKQYIAIRGTIERITETILIKVVDISHLITKSHTLVSRAINSSMPNKWKPLSVFKWQMLPSNDIKSFEQRRKERILQIAKSFKTNGNVIILRVMEGGMNSIQGVFHASGWVMSTVSKSLSTVKQSPIGIPAANAGTIRKSDLAVRSNQRGRRFYHSAEKRPKNMHTQEKSSDVITTAKVNGIKTEEDDKPNVSEENNFIITNPRLNRKNFRKNFGKKARFHHSGEKRNESMIAPSPKLTSSQAISALAIGTGAIASIASGLSLPVVISGSTVVMTSYAIAKAKQSGIDSDMRDGAKKLFRQSRSVQNIDKLVDKSKSISSNMIPRRLQDSAIERQISLEEYIESESVTVIDTAAQTVSSSEKNLATTPLVGDVLSLIDWIALNVETGIEIVGRKMGLHKKTRMTEDGWVLLNSFDDDLIK